MGHHRHLAVAFHPPGSGYQARMPVQVGDDVDGEPTLMTCDQCGATAPFDASLPYVKQTAAFDTGHRCEVGLDAMAYGPG